MSESVLLEPGKRYKFHIKERLVGFAEYNDKIFKVRLWNNDSNNFVLGSIILCNIERMESADDVVWVFVRDIEYL